MNHAKRLLRRGTALLIGAALLALAGHVLAQNGSDALPPHIIDVWPYPGEEVAPSQAVTITFDQAMDRASVEAAWQIDPAAPMSFTWRDDRTLEVLPEGGWERATRYTITLAVGAQAANGLPLEDAYSFFVQTVGYLEVSTVIPAPDTEGIAADATITIAFNRPVVPLLSTGEQGSLPQPITFDPPIEGTGDWVNTSIYVFTPAKPLAGGTTFTVTAPAGLTDVTGATLRQDFRWRFKTLPPQVLNIRPQQGQTNVRLDSSIEVQFSQPMDPLSTEAAFSLLFRGDRVPGEFIWSGDNTWLTFKPAAPLVIESVYIISLAPTAASASGEATLEEGFNYSFTTVPYPGIQSTTPANGERNVYPGGGVGFYFKSPMNTQTFEGKVEVIKPEGLQWEPSVSGDFAFYMQFSTQPETEYVIRFNRGAEDIYGNAIETDYTLSFTTGAMEPSAYLPSRERFMITNAYREDTRVAVSVTANPTAAFTLHSIPADKIGALLSGSSDDQRRALNAATLIRTWSQKLDAAPFLQGVDEILLASDEGGQLPPGVYYLQMLATNYNYPQTLTLGVVTANLTVKRAPDEILIWATDIESAEPLADLLVTVYTFDGRVMGSGTTDKDGIFRMGSAEPYSSIYAIAEGRPGYGVWFSWSASTPPDVGGYLYTDRPIYRPGQTVYYRGALRDRQDMTYTLPQAEQVKVSITMNWGAQVLYEGSLPVTGFGTFSGQFDLPEDAPLGSGEIVITYKHGYDASVTFTVAEFRVPEYKVEVTPDYGEIIQGDDLKAAIAASYYFGGAVADAPLSWNALGEVAWFNYTGPGRYSFTDDTQDWFYGLSLGSGQEMTDPNGQVIADVQVTTAPSILPMTISIEGTVTDESGQYISGRTTVMAHPANVYVGLRADRYFGREGQPLTLDLIAVTPQSEPLAGQKIDLAVVELRWERIPIEGQFGRYNWERKEIEVATDSVTTGSDGTARYSFTPPKGGIYRVRAVSRDEYERVNSSTMRFWVTGQTSVWWGEPSDTIDLIANQDSYEAGQTAEILVPIPFSGVSYVLMTAERAGIQQAEVFRVEGSTLIYQLPITEAHVPTVYVTATLMKGTDEENLNPSYKVGQITLNVTPVNQRIEVTVTPSATRAQPGDTVTLDVKTVDSRGEPVSAEVGITVTDLAILSLMPPNSGPIESAFYGQQGLYVDTGVALSALLDTMIDELLKEQENRERLYAQTPSAMPTATLGGAMDMADGMVVAEMAAMPVTGGGPSQPEVTVRQDFRQTPLWSPHLVTDATGRASITLTLPDNLTTWRVDARGLTTATQVGDTTVDVMSTLPLLTRPVAPRFFVVGDRVTLASVINNNTDSPQTVQATLEASGVTFESDSTQSITIPAGQRARAEWVVVVEDVPYVDLTFYAIGADGFSDASKPTLATGPEGTIPVYRYTAPDTVGTGGVLRTEGARTEAISLPPRLDVDQGELTIKVDPSLAATTIDALDYLRNYEHQCIEQTVSRFLPNIITFRALRGLGIDDPELEANLRAALDYALDRLAKEQNPDGGWGWFARMESNPYVTAYAALGLIEARDAGFDFDTSMIDRAVNFVRSQSERPNTDTPAYRLNRLAFYAYVLGRGGYASQRDLDVLLEYRLEMDYWARAFLLMAYHEVNPEAPAITQLISDLQSGAILSATGAHWEEAELDWWNWSSDTRTTALALSALARVQPNHDLLPNVVRWLMVARQGDHWPTTQETAWAVMGLTDWMVASGELEGNYDYAVTLNGDLLGEGTVTPDTVREGKVLRVAVSDLLKDEINRLTLIRGEGEGVLYYTAHLKTRLWASEAKPISRGLSVTREYFSANGDPITQAKVGDVITVRVTINLSQEIYYFVLEDPIPAGTEPVNTSLLTTSQLSETPTIRPTYDPFWYWGWWVWDHTEMRDEKVNLYADFLPRGTYVYTYQVQASVPGEFQTMPSHGYAFYFPEVFGRGAGTLFTVTPAE